nr:MAG TPA: tail assembly chaperone protein [Caudoviricetes sp.]
MEDIKNTELENSEESLTLSEFLAANPVEGQTEEVVISNRLKDFKFKIGSMSKGEREKYLNICLIKDRTGRVVKQDLTKFNELVALNHCLYPDFNDLGFIKSCNAKTPVEALYKVLKLGEIENLAQVILEFNGFCDMEELRAKAKN